MYDLTHMTLAKCNAALAKTRAAFQVTTLKLVWPQKNIFFITVVQERNVAGKKSRQFLSQDFKTTLYADLTMLYQKIYLIWGVKAHLRV